MIGSITLAVASVAILAIMPGFMILAKERPVMAGLLLAVLVSLLLGLTTMMKGKI